MDDLKSDGSGCWALDAEPREILDLEEAKIRSLSIPAGAAFDPTSFAFHLGEPYVLLGNAMQLLLPTGARVEIPTPTWSGTTWQSAPARVARGLVYGLETLSTSSDFVVSGSDAARFLVDSPFGIAFAVNGFLENRDFVATYDPAAFRFRLFPIRSLDNSIAGEQIAGLAADRNGNCWLLGYNNNTLTVISPDSTIRRYTISKRPPTEVLNYALSSRFNRLQYDGSNRVWFALPNGVVGYMNQNGGLLVCVDKSFSGPVEAIPIDRAHVAVLTAKPHPLFSVVDLNHATTTACR